MEKTNTTAINLRLICMAAQRYISANQLDRYVEELKEQGITDEDLRACSNDYVLANTIGLEES